MISESHVDIGFLNMEINRTKKMRLIMDGDSSTGKMIASVLGYHLAVKKGQH